MKLLTYSPFSHRPSNILSTPQNFCISKLFSVSLMTTAYSKEKLKTILMQNFGDKHGVFAPAGISRRRRNPEEALY